MSAILSVALTSALLTEPSLNTLTYQVKQHTFDPSVVTVSVNTSAFTQFQVIPARTMQSDIQPSLICETSTGEQNIATYNTDLTCTNVSWTLSLAEVDQHGFDIAEQLDSYSADKGWFFISEFNSLPRFVNHDQQPIDANIILPNGKKQIMPKTTQPPLFLVGGLTPISLDINGYQVEISSDTQQVLDAIEQWKPAFETQLRYLVSLYPQRATRSWNVAFFARDKTAGSVSGAAGSDTILVNALQENGKLDFDSMPMLLKIAAHESMHMIEQSTPLWASESLAEYYAMKSLKKTSYSFVSADTQWQQFKQSFPLASTGLLEAHQKVSAQGMQQYYPLFYVKGPAFWLNIDNALTEAGSSLDKLVANFTFEATGELSPSSVKQIMQVIGEEGWQKIAENYL
tara:strand:+ start:12978 stop:14177 length:1200 start_codon:yes stop_codon:yes gene_type:complete